MAKLIPYDVSGVEESTGGTGVKIKPGVTPARIVRCSKRAEKRDGSPANDIEVALDVGEEYDWVFTYIGLRPESDWKLAEFVRAVGLKEKGNLDPEKLVGKVIRVKINSGTYEGEYSPSAGRLMKAQPGDEDAIGERVSESSSRGNGAEPDVDEPSAEAEDGFIPSRELLPDGELDPEVGSYDDWKDEDLVGEVEDRGLTLPGGRGGKRDKAIKALRADDEAFYADVGGATENGTSAEADDYDNWDIEQLKQEWSDRQMGDLPAFRGRNAEDRVKAKIAEDLRADDEASPFSS